MRRDGFSVPVDDVVAAGAFQRSIWLLSPSWTSTRLSTSWATPWGESWRGPALALALALALIPRLRRLYGTSHRPSSGMPTVHRCPYSALFCMLAHSFLERRARLPGLGAPCSWSHYRARVL